MPSKAGTSRPLAPAKPQALRFGALAPEDLDALRLAIGQILG
jgi:hypothetical protein